MNIEEQLDLFSKNLRSRILSSDYYQWRMYKNDLLGELIDLRNNSSYGQVKYIKSRECPFQWESYLSKEYLESCRPPLRAYNETLFGAMEVVETLLNYHTDKSEEYKHRQRELQVQLQAEERQREIQRQARDRLAGNRNQPVPTPPANRTIAFAIYEPDDDIPELVAQEGRYVSRWMDTDTREVYHCFTPVGFVGVLNAPVGTERRNMECLILLDPLPTRLVDTLETQLMGRILEPTRVQGIRITQADTDTTYAINTDAVPWDGNL